MKLDIFILSVFKIICQNEKRVFVFEMLRHGARSSYDKIIRTGNPDSLDEY